VLLSDVFDKRSIKLNLESKNKEDVFEELIETITAIHPGFDRDSILAAVQSRENKMNTSIASGVAIPHGVYPGTDNIFGAIGISSLGIDYNAPDEKKVHCVFLIVLGDAAREKHLNVLNRIMSLINSEGLSLIRKARTSEEIHNILYHLH
jgi:PTS system fructose-specific IIC component/PTS system nitrogen regulatory IIA component